MKIGIDWGGTKIEAAAFDSLNNKEITRNRIDTPKDDYQKILNAVCNIILDTAGSEKEITVGIGMPGSLHPETGLVQVSNTKVLDGKNVNAGKDYNSVFAVILGTGVGAGYVVGKQLLVGPNKLTGEWGQNPIPGPMDSYEKSVKRHCGRIGAIEVFLSGPGLESSYEYESGHKIPSMKEQQKHLVLL